MEKERLVSKIPILTLSGFCFLTFAFGWELTPMALSDVVPEAKLILKGKIVHFEKKIETDVKEEGFYTISVENVIFGNLSTEKIKAKYTFNYPYIWVEGKVVGWFSPTTYASGLEWEVQQGSSYIFFFSPDIKSPDSYNELIRVDSVDKEGEISKILKGLTSSPSSE